MDYICPACLATVALVTIEKVHGTMKRTELPVHGEPRCPMSGEVPASVFVVHADANGNLSGKFRTYEGLEFTHRGRVVME